MKSAEDFKRVIQEYLDNRAQEDSLFAVSYAKEDKNIDDCVIYIINQVKASGCTAFTDDEVFSMAVHYYDEDNIKVGKAVSGVQIVTNHSIELTEEEKEQARKDAIKKYQDDAIAEMKKKPTKPKKKAEVVESPSLFDL